MCKLAITRSKLLLELRPIRYGWSPALLAQLAAHAAVDKEGCLLLNQFWNLYQLAEADELIPALAAKVFKKGRHDIPVLLDDPVMQNAGKGIMYLRSLLKE